MPNFALSVRPVAIVVSILVVLVALLGARVVAQERGSRSPLPSAFTFQGRAVLDGVPVDGSCDIRASLFTAESGGTQVGSTQELPSVAVTNGNFQVALDFGLAAFDGEQRFLAIALRCPAGSGTFVDLPGRQELTATPYALYAQQVPWTGITGVPPGIGTGWDNVIVVAKSGAQFDDVQEAIDSITDESATNRYLVWVAPGVYEGQIDIPSYVVVRGAGRDTTVLLSHGGADADAGTAVSMATFTELSDLTIEITGSAATATGIYATGTGSAIGFEQVVSDVYVLCTLTTSCTGARINGTVFQGNRLDVLIYVPFPLQATNSATGMIMNTAFLELNDIEVIVDRFGPGLESIGVYAQVNSSYTITGGTIRANSQGNAIGLIYGAGNTYNLLSGASLSAYSSTGTATGISVSSNGQMLMNNSQVRVESPATTKGIAISGGSIRVEDVVLDVFGSPSIGIEHILSNQMSHLTNVSINRGNKAEFGITGIAGDTSSQSFLIRSSWINAFVGIAGAANRTYRLTDTMLSSKTAGGTFSCISSYNEFITELPATC